jgi:hypothetical protein
MLKVLASSPPEVSMTVIRSARTRLAVPLFAATVFAVACSSNTPTGPDTSHNAALARHFETLLDASTGFRATIYSDIVAMLAQGAPVDTGTITVNGATQRVSVITERSVRLLNGAPLDSQFAIAAWNGDGTDSVILFDQSVGTFTLWAFGEAAGEDTGGSLLVVSSPPGAQCREFLSAALPDIDIPAPLRSSFRRPRTRSRSCSITATALQSRCLTKYSAASA